jgi:hypothetical protein
LVWTKDHFSSNWTSRVRGGKAHEFVVGVVGLLAGHADQAGNGVLVGVGEAPRLPSATALLEMFQNRGGALQTEMGTLEGGALQLGEGMEADGALDHAVGAAAAAEAIEAKVLAPALAVGRAILLRASKVGQGAACGGRGLGSGHGRPSSRPILILSQAKSSAAETRP